MSNQSETNKFFNELKGLAEDFDSLRKENEALKHEVNYWRIEAQTDHDRWLRVLAENDKLRAEVERLNSIIISGGAVVPDAKPFE